MTVVWSSQISETKWQRLRRELKANRLEIPFSSGMAQNRKTGYHLSSNYYTNTNQLVLRVSYPGSGWDYARVLAVTILLDNLFDSNGKAFLEDA